MGADSQQTEAEITEARIGSNLDMQGEPRMAKKKSTTKGAGLDKERLAAMIEEATVDAYGDEEQATGWFTMLEEHLELPFETKVLGVAVTVTRIELRDGGLIVAVCTRARDRQAIPLVDLPLPSPKPAGADWIEAYRHWLRGE